MLCLLFNFYKENAVREWSFTKAIIIKTYDGYDPIPVPLNIIYRIYKIFRKESPSRQNNNVSVKKQSVVFVQCVTVFVCFYFLFCFV